jgi:MFS family permease
MRNLVGFLLALAAMLGLIVIGFDHPEYGWRTMLILAAVATLAVIVLLGVLVHFSPQQRYARKRRALLERSFRYPDERDSQAAFRRTIGNRGPGSHTSVP